MDDSTLETLKVIIDTYNSRLSAVSIKAVSGLRIVDGVMTLLWQAPDGHVGEMSLHEFIYNEQDWSLWRTLFGSEVVHARLPIEGAPGKYAFRQMPLFLYHMLEATFDRFVDPDADGDVDTVLEYIVHIIEQGKADRVGTFEEEFASDKDAVH